LLSDLEPIASAALPLSAWPRTRPWASQPAREHVQAVTRRPDGDELGGQLPLSFGGPVAAVSEKLESQETTALLITPTSTLLAVQPGRAPLGSMEPCKAPTPPAKDAQRPHAAASGWGRPCDDPPRPSKLSQLDDFCVQKWRIFLQSIRYEKGWWGWRGHYDSTHFSGDATGFG